MTATNVFALGMLLSLVTFALGLIISKHTFNGLVSAHTEVLKKGVVYKVIARTESTKREYRDTNYYYFYVVKDTTSDEKSFLGIKVLCEIQVPDEFMIDKKGSIVQVH